MQPTITIPQNSSQLTINQQGQVSVILPGSTAQTVVGQLGLTRFINKSGLQSIGDNLFVDTPASGPPQDGIANTDGFGDMQQRNLEQANVEVVSEISDLIAAQRAYEMNAKVVSAADPDDAGHHRHVPLRRTMMLRSIVIAAVLVGLSGAAFAQSEQDGLSSPVLRANITVSSDVVRIGDLIENAGTAAQIAIFRAPDLGTTGSLPVSQLLPALRAHQVIGVDTRDIREVSVTRSSRMLVSKDIELQIARVLERRNGLGDAANISVTFERDLRELQLDAAHTGDMRASIVRYDPRNGRFDITFEIANDVTYSPTKLRFTGTAVENRRSGRARPQRRTQ